MEVITLLITGRGPPYKDSKEEHPGSKGHQHPGVFCWKKLLGPKFLDTSKP